MGQGATVVVRIGLMAAAMFGQMVGATHAAGPPPAIVVNGVGIPAEALEAEYRWMLSQRQMAHPVNEKSQAEIRSEAVDRVIVWEIVRQKLDGAGRCITSAEIETRVAADRKRIGDGFEKYIGVLGQDEDSYRRRSECIQNFKRYQQEYIEPGLSVSEEEIAAFHGRAGAYRSPEAFRVQYLQISSFDRTGRLVHSDLGSVASFARKKLLEGLSPEAVALEVSSNQVSGRVANGFYEMGKVPLYEPSLLPLKAAGEVSEVLKVTDNSYLIFKLVEREPAKDVSLEQARPEIRRLLLEQKLSQAIPAHVADLKRKADITYQDPKYSPWQ